MLKKCIGLFAAAVIGLFAMGACMKSPAQEMAEIGKQMPAVACDKMMECMKPMMDKMPAQAKDMMPAMMKSKEGCMEEMSKEEMKRQEKKEKITKEMVQAAKDCMADFKKMECSGMMGGKGGPESCAKLSAMTKDM